jgi:hypothetical protein
LIIHLNTAFDSAQVTISYYEAELKKAVKSNKRKNVLSVIEAVGAFILGAVAAGAINH